MTQARRPAGTNIGGQFAPSRHQEATGTLQLSPSMKPLGALRLDSMSQSGNAVRALADDSSIDTHRGVDASFPAGAYGDAVNAVMIFHGRLSGTPTPEPTSPVQESISAYRARSVNASSGWNTGSRSLNDLRSNSQAAVLAAISHLRSPDVEELSRADAQFPADEHGRAVQALEHLSERLNVQPVAPLTPQRHDALAQDLDTDSRYAEFRPAPWRDLPPPPSSRVATQRRQDALRV